MHDQNSLMQTKDIFNTDDCCNIFNIFVSHRYGIRICVSLNTYERSRNHWPGGRSIQVPGLFSLSRIFGIQAKSEARPLIVQRVKAHSSASAWRVLHTCDNKKMPLSFQAERHFSKYASWFMSLDAQAILPRHFYLVLKLLLIKTQLRIDHLALHMLQHTIFLLPVKITQRNQKIHQ